MNGKQRRRRARVLAAYTRAKFDLPGGYKHRWTQEQFWYVIELLHTLALIKADMEARVFAALDAMGGKVPFTDPGIKAIEDEVHKMLAEHEALGNLKPYEQEVVILPPTETDRESRILRTVTFKVPLHAIHITGKIDV